MDRFYRKRYKIVGGPGCGKTYKVIKILKNYFNSGLQPNQVLMIGFAKATVNTLKERAMDELNFSENQANRIKTIHKYCKDIACHGWDIFNNVAKRDFLKKLKTDEDSWVMLDTDKDKQNNEIDDVAMWDEKTDLKVALIFQLINFARHKRNKLTDPITGKPVFDVNRWTKMSIDAILAFHSDHNDFKFSKIQRHEIKYCYKNFLLFKKHNSMIDFEDMLEKSLVENIHFPEYKGVIVDEVQDLTPLEWKVVAKLGKTTEELFLVGDDDQAIYGWKGANVKIFQKWSCQEKHHTFLKKTHRLPVKIYDLAQKIIKDIKPEHRIGGKNREEYYPCSKECHNKINQPGIIQTLYDTEEFNEIIDIDSNAIMCARSRKQIYQYGRYLKDRGIIWKEKDKNPEGGGAIKSSFPKTPRDIIKSWDTLKIGTGVNGKEVRTLIERFKPGLVQRGKKGALTHPDTCPDEFKDPDQLFTFKDLSEKYFILADINKPWFDVFNFTTTRKKEKKKPNALFDDDTDFNNYLKICYDNDSTLNKTDIIVSTIHGVKGMQRKKVIISSDWGYSFKNYYSGLMVLEEEELRICYVGITRAQEELYILDNGNHKTKFPYLII